MLVELLMNLASLNFGYFVDLAMGNLFWVFGFVAAAYYFRGKNFWLRLITIIFVVYGLMDLQRVHNLVFFAGSALLILFMGRMSVLIFAESTKGGAKYLPFLFALVTYSVLFFVNFSG